MDSQQESIALCVIYAPNSDYPLFFEELETILTNYCANKIIIGDFNLVLDVSIDRHNSTHNNHQSCEKVKDIMNNLYLTDVWRDRNPGVKRFSWRNRQSASRIDNVLISQGLDSMVSNCTYLQGILTDHSACYISVETTKNKRGVGYWKLNTTLLKQQECRNKISECIEDVTTKSVNEKADSIETWLKIKHAVRKCVQAFARSNASKKKLVIANLSEQVDNYEGSMLLNRDQMDMYLRTKTDLEELVLERAESLIFSK